MVERHVKKNNIFTFVTAETKMAYTRVIRDKRGNIQDLIEKKERPSIAIGKAKLEKEKIAKAKSKEVESDNKEVESDNKEAES